MAPTRVLILDSRPVLSEGLAVGLSEVPDLDVVGATTSPDTMLALLAERKPDVLVLGWDLARAGEADLLARIRESEVNPAIVLLLSESDGEAASQALRVDACAFVSKEAPLAELANAVRWAGRGERWISPMLLTNLLDDSLRRTAEQEDADEWSSLTERELEILLLLVEGLSHKEVAERLDIALNTVRTHTRNIQIKLHVRSTLAAVSFAMAHGMRPHDLPV